MASRHGRWLVLGLATVGCLLAIGRGVVAAEASAEINPSELAKSVTIYRDAYGMPHIDGPTDEAVLFGFGYCQAEDYFWQIEDSYVMGLGRYAELYGKQFLAKDMRNRAFEIPQRRKEDFEKLDPEPQRSGRRVRGGHQLLSRHASRGEAAAAQADRALVSAGVRPRGHRSNLWAATCTFRRTKCPAATKSRSSKKKSKAATGSNAWAISGSKTRSGKAMLLINPHQPYYGFGQFYEAHLRSGEGWNFTGASFFGTPLPTFGHNEYCGWGMTTNEPNVGSSWRETFDDPDEPLNYRYGRRLSQGRGVEGHDQGQTHRRL